MKGICAFFYIQAFNYNNFVSLERDLSNWIFESVILTILRIGQSEHISSNKTLITIQNIGHSIFHLIIVEQQKKKNNLYHLRVVFEIFQKIIYYEK